MLALIHELVGDLNIQKQHRRVDLFGWARLFVLPRLHEIRTIAWAIERHLALLTAALRANTPMNSGAEAFFLADFADGTTQCSRLLLTLLHPCHRRVGMRLTPITV